MAIPRADSKLGERLKRLEDQVRRIRLLPSLTQSAVEPLAVKGSGWFDSSTGNEPKVFDGTTWVPVRDETIAVAQGTADVAQSTAVAAAADASTALGKFPITSTDITDGAISTPKLSANAIDGMVITGALIRTAASGRRLELDSTAGSSQILAYSGDVSEITPGRIQVNTDRVYVLSPDLGNDVSALSLRAADAGHAVAELSSADIVDINAGGNGTGTGRIFVGDGDATHDPTPNNGVSVVTTGDGKFLYNGSPVMVAGSNPQPVAVADATSLTNAALTTTYAAGSPVVGTAFTAPPTGKVYITVGGRIQIQTSGNTIYLSFEVRTGATVGSGTVVLATDAGRAVAAGGNATGLTFIRGESSKRYLLTGLTPGTSYNARTMHACQSTTATGDLFNRDLLIEPVL